MRACLRAPRDAVEFLPRVAEVVAVEIDDPKFPRAVEHHVADVVVAVLEALRAVFEQAAVFLDIRDDRLAALELDRAASENLDLPARLRVEALRPVGHIVRRRDAVDLLEDLPRLHAVHVLLHIRQVGERRFKLHAVDPLE